MDSKTNSMIKEFLGDEKAQTSVFHDISDKDYGKGVSTGVTVRLTCGQSEEEILGAGVIASKLAKKIMAQEHAELLNAWKGR